VNRKPNPVAAVARGRWSFLYPRGLPRGRRRDDGVRLAGPPPCRQATDRELGRAPMRSPIWPCSLRGLPSRPGPRGAVGSYPTVSPLPGERDEPVLRAVCFLWHFFPSPGLALPSAMPCGVRTFLPPDLRPGRRPSVSLRPGGDGSRPARAAATRHRAPPSSVRARRGLRILPNACAKNEPLLTTAARPPRGHSMAETSLSTGTSPERRRRALGAGRHPPREHRHQSRRRSSPRTIFYRDPHRRIFKVMAALSERPPPSTRSQ